VKYKMVGDHPEDLADGRVLGPGEEADLDKDAVGDPHNQRLIEEGLLIEAESGEEKSKSGRASKKEEGE
jgi:hypothetical protein